MELDPVNPGSWSTWYKILAKPFAAAREVLYPQLEPVDSRLARLCAELDAKLISERAFVDEFLHVLSDELNRKRRLNSFHYRKFAHSLVEALRERLSTLHVVWGDLHVYLDEVEEVWIAYEPVADLLLDETGAFGLLLKELRSRKISKVVYLQTTDRYFNDMKKSLTKLGVPDAEIAKLHFGQIPRRRPYPQAVYQTSNGPLVLRASELPVIHQKADGSYASGKTPPDDWLSFVSDDIAIEVAKELRPYLPP